MASDSHGRVSSALLQRPIRHTTRFSSTVARVEIAGSKDRRRVAGEVDCTRTSLFVRESFLSPAQYLGLALMQTSWRTGRVSLKRTWMAEMAEQLGGSARRECSDSRSGYHLRVLVSFVIV
jgi:hypothetical protein